MPVKSKFFGPRAKNSHKVWIEVHSETVESMINAVHSAVSPYALTQFMKLYADPYFQDAIIKRFGGHGEAGTPGGTWAPLEASTLMIRHALGYFDDEAWNERTGELLYHVAYTRDYSTTAFGAIMTIPDQADTDYVLEKKLRTAQEGYVQGPNDMIPGAVTPPRPVLDMNVADEAAMHALLHMHVAYWVATHTSVTP